MRRRDFLAKAGQAAAGSVAGLAGCRAAGGVDAPSAAAAAATSRSRPNILFLFADDLGYGDLGCYGCPDAKTPAVDGLAREGVRFTRYYAAAPECSPTRTALLTGRYLHRVGGLECAIGTNNVGRYDDAIRLAKAHDLGLPADQSTLAVALKQAGYRTAVFGKWHLGYERKFWPDRHGFDRWLCVLGGNCDYFHHCEVTGLRTLYDQGKPARREEHMTDLITKEAAAYLQARGAEARQLGTMGKPPRPFFLYVPFTAPHSPYQGPGDRRPKPLGEAEWNKGNRAGYVALVEHLDRGVATILKALDDAGLRESTLVFFVSDNGGNKKARNAPYSGYKSSLYEGGIRVPCVVRWPGVLPKGKRVEQVAITMDLTASMLAAARATPPRGHTLDGIDVLARVRDGAAPVKRTLFWRARRGMRTWRAVRDGDVKYLSRQDRQKVQEWLFDLHADPREKTDLKQTRPKEFARMKALLARMEKDLMHTRGREG